MLIDYNSTKISYTLTVLIIIKILDFFLNYCTIVNMKKLIILFLGLVLTSCTSTKTNCFCEYNMYKPIDREKSIIGVCLFDGDFDKVSAFFTEKGDKAVKVTKEDVKTLTPIMQRLDDDKLGQFSSEERDIMDALSDKLKVDCILIAIKKHEELPAVKREFYFVILYSFDLYNNCCTYYRKEFFPTVKETFDSKLLETIDADYKW